MTAPANPLAVIPDDRKTRSAATMFRGFNMQLQRLNLGEGELR